MKFIRGFELIVRGICRRKSQVEFSSLCETYPKSCFKETNLRLGECGSALECAFRVRFCKESEQIRCPKCCYLPTHRTLGSTLYLYMNLLRVRQLPLRSTDGYSVAPAAKGHSIDSCQSADSFFYCKWF
jgi:hypothetical protein